MTISETVDLDGLRAMLTMGQPVTVLDVRKTEDRAEWSIPGSLHVDAYAALSEGDTSPLGALDLPRDRPVVTVCGAGKTSLVATQHLRERGYDARSLAGGMKAWSLAWNTAEIPLSENRVTVLQVRRTGKGCLSYIVGSAGQALVLDASLDPKIYLDLAGQQGWRVTHVVDTHIHADHLSRSRVLAARSGAALHLPRQCRATFPFAPLGDGDVLAFGQATLTTLATPGHTMESMSYVLDGQVLFTGDTLFLNAVGRPDLEASASASRVRAQLLYRSLQRLAALPGTLVILPGHTSEPVPFDGAPIAAPLVEVLPQIQPLTLPEDAFVASLLSRVPPSPPNHAAIIKLNESGELPEGDPTELEAGANRCAIA